MRHTEGSNVPECPCHSDMYVAIHFRIPVYCFRTADVVDVPFFQLILLRAFDVSIILKFFKKYLHLKS